jgi:hypothetical protein
MERRLTLFGKLFEDWSRTEQARLLEQIRWLESGARHLGARTGNGQWVDVTESELMRLKLTFARLETLRLEQEREVVG